MGRDYVSELLPSAGLLFISMMIYGYGAPMELHRQGETEELADRPVPEPLCPPKIPQGLTRMRTRTSAVTARQLTVQAKARPMQSDSKDLRRPYHDSGN
jgi:hypothetical protein